MEFKTPFESGSERHKAAQTLLDAGACARCALRFVNYRVSDFYVSSEECVQSRLAEWELTLPSSTSTKPCPACLGFLEDSADAEKGQDELSLQVTDYVRESRFEFRCFTLALSLPPSILVRRQALWAHLRLTYPNVPLFSLNKVDDQIVSVKEVLKWRLSHRLSVSLEKPFESDSPTVIDARNGAITVQVQLAHGDSSNECQFMAKSMQNMAPRRAKRKHATSSGSISKQLQLLPFESFCALAKQQIGVPPKAPEVSGQAAVQVTRAPVYIMGNYTKMSRAVSQTPWTLTVGGARKTPTSVQEEVCSALAPLFEPPQITEAQRANVLQRRKQRRTRQRLVNEGTLTKASAPGTFSDDYVYQFDDEYEYVKFHAAGREDADVRMLGASGGGRPFVCEVRNARRDLAFRADDREAYDQTHALLQSLAERHNKGASPVSVRAVRLGSSDAFDALKQGEQRKRKSYRCLVRLNSAVSQETLATAAARVTPETPLSVAQRTPLRVLHRRAPMVRNKKVFSLSFQSLSPCYLVVDVVAQAGTYIKELVHGDRGRTSPSLGDLLGTRADILQLDVLDVHYELPDDDVD
ncbi:MAG: hypothetical protein MHM6MM_006416 [Cercozoa sp. M6MM]